MKEHELIESIPRGGTWIVEKGLTLIADNKRQ